MYIGHQILTDAVRDLTIDKVELLLFVYLALSYDTNMFTAFDSISDIELNCFMLLCYITLYSPGGDNIHAIFKRKHFILISDIVYLGGGGCLTFKNSHAGKI